MRQENLHRQGILFRNTPLHFLVFVTMVLLLTNLGAVVDHFLHPEIPYFDEEHLCVGLATGLVSALLLGLIVLYARHLEQALAKIQTLELFLPICASCKKIRIKDATDTEQEVWQSVEAYISSRTNATFTHGICPSCMEKLYPEESS